MISNLYIHPRPCVAPAEWLVKLGSKDLRHNKNESNRNAVDSMYNSRKLHSLKLLVVVGELLVLILKVLTKEPVYGLSIGWCTNL